MVVSLLFAASLSSGSSSLSPFSAATATIQSPLGVRWSSLVTSTVIWWVARMFRWPWAVKVSSWSICVCFSVAEFKGYAIRFRKEDRAHSL